MLEPGPRWGGTHTADPHSFPPTRLFKKEKKKKNTPPKHTEHVRKQPPTHSCCLFLCLSVRKRKRKKNQNTALERRPAPINMFVTSTEKCFKTMQRSDTTPSDSILCVTDPFYFIDLFYTFIIVAWVGFRLMFVTRAYLQHIFWITV